MPVVVSSLLVGMVFGAGLAISQMMNPAKVLGFLDFAGNWDPTLGFVMAGALVAAIPGFLLAKKGTASLLGGPFRLPTRRDIDSPLVVGAAIFGIGWGLAGFCPGPALAALGSGLWQVFVFVAAMIAGMLLFRILPTK